MTLRRLHWKNSLLGELLYVINVVKVCLWRSADSASKKHLWLLSLQAFAVRKEVCNTQLQVLQ